MKKLTNGGTEMSRSILLIEDDRLVSATIRNLLEDRGFSLTMAFTGEEGEKYAATTNFDLVISDIRMPGQGGIRTAERIKEFYEKKGHRCGYILITGYTEEDTPKYALRLGISQLLLKPFDLKDFLSAIDREFESIEAEEELRKAPQPIAPLRAKKPRGIEFPRRVVVTGIGVVAPNGIGVVGYWQGLKEGKNCVNRISFFDCSSFPSQAGAEIRNFKPEEFISDKGEIKRMGRSSHLGIAAAKLAVRDAGLELNGRFTEEMGVILGSATSGLEYVEVDFRALEKGGVRKVRPYLGIAGFGGAVSSEISRALEIRGQSITISTGCTAATDAMGYGLEKIRFGKSDLLITGGADACVTPGILAAFCQMGAVSTWKEEFHRASRPFNKDRDGFVLGEGAWIFIFEELEHALSRKAKIYGEILGYGATCDAWHMAKPHPSGEYTAQAIRMALDDAQVLPEEVDLFEAYGNGTPVNDSYETGVVKRVFGKHARNLAMPSIKSMMGHPLGASGAQQLAGALLAINEGFVHPTINYEVPDPECDLNYVPNKGSQKEVKVAVCNSIAFGAKNSALVVRSY